MKPAKTANTTTKTTSEKTSAKPAFRLGNHVPVKAVIVVLMKVAISACTSTPPAEASFATTPIISKITK